MASKNRCRKIKVVSDKERLHVHSTTHVTVNPKVATEETPKAFLCVSAVKMSLHVMYEAHNGGLKAENIKY
jgi:hypothetical protein